MILKPLGGIQPIDFQTIWEGQPRLQLIDTWFIKFMPSLLMAKLSHTGEERKQNFKTFQLLSALYLLSNAWYIINMNNEKIVSSSRRMRAATKN